MDTITDLILEKATEQPFDTAVIYAEEKINYAELKTLSQKAAGGLRALGVKKGDRIAFWLPNTIAYIVLYLGCAQLGAIATAVNTRFRSSEVSDIIKRSGAKIIIMWPSFRDIDFLKILGECNTKTLKKLKTIIVYSEKKSPETMPPKVKHCNTISYSELISSPPNHQYDALENTGCNIFTTSGTTKAPKFVLHSHSSISIHARIVAEKFGYSAADGSLLVVLPICGVFGFTQLMASLASGRPLILESAFDAVRLVNLIEEHQIQHTNATDDMIQAIISVPGGVKALSKMRFIGTAAFGTDFKEFSRKAESVGIKLCGLYGMSEVQALFALRDPALDFDKRITPGGTLVSDESQVRVRDPDTGEILGHNNIGELELKGPSLMWGYFSDLDATAETMSGDGFIRSGDLGYTQDSRNFVYLQRIGDVLRLGGFLVSPAEIEECLQNHETVSGAQVVGIKTKRGTAPIGFVTLEKNAAFDEDLLRQHCLKGLAKFKAPLHIFPIPEFPTTKSANGTKIQRAELRKKAVELTSTNLDSNS